MGQRVLVIDDQELLADIITEAFRDEGYEAEVAYGGVAGLRLFERTHHSLVVADLVMPDVDGLDIIRGIRRIDRVSKVIAISGGGALESQLLLNAARAIGADAVMQKPFLPSELVTLAARLVPPEA
ncbi:Chemotaxis protein CheY [Alphaproteobacteria bacterium SO-S41]|nr:Chemotaxis protein CheY [Alphaproteobacteria bacterium SO-S41]